MREATLVSLHRELHSISRLRRNPATECHQFQCRAIHTIVRSERLIRKERRLIAAQRERLAATNGVQLSKQESLTAKRQIECSTERIDHHRWTIDVTRSI